jgi:HK97 gp10 family phage protein
MDIQVDTSKIKALEADLKTVGRSLDRQTLGPALVDASKPAVEAVREDAPKGAGYQRVSLSHKRGRKNAYRRGGATKQDVRSKAVEGVGAEVVRVLVGVSKKSGKVGWRTIFLTLGTKRGVRANPFIDRGVGRTINQVVNSFMSSVSNTVSRILTRARR